MAIKVLIKRTFKPGTLAKASPLLNRLRYGAMGQEGYISSETLSEYRDPHRVVVVSMWRTLEDWQHWKDSAIRDEYESELQKILAGATDFELYNLGIPPAGVPQ
jgi:heme-degrading monooxygenase HmoA